MSAETIIMVSDVSNVILHGLSSSITLQQFFSINIKDIYFVWGCIEGEKRFQAPLSFMYELNKAIFFPGIDVQLYGATL